MFEHAEHDKWINGKSPIINDYNNKVQEILSVSSSKGFIVPPSNIIGIISSTAEQAKIELTKVNSLIYKDQTGIMLQELEFNMKMEVEYEALEMAIHIQHLLSILELEQAESEDVFRRGKIDIAKLNADIERRSYSLMRGKADIESQLIDYRMRETEAQKLGIDKEVELINAKVETATEQLKILTYLKQLIDKERIIVGAEERRAAILSTMISIKDAIAKAKQGILPLYSNKASAKEAQAEAVKSEVAWKEALIELGFDKIKLKDAKSDADLTLKNKEVVLEQFKLDLDISEYNLKRLKSEYQVLLTKYSTNIALEVKDIENAIKQASADLSIDSSSTRKTDSLSWSARLAGVHASNASSDAASMVNKITGVAGATSTTNRTSTVNTKSDTYRYSDIAQAISSSGGT